MGTSYLRPDDINFNLMATRDNSVVRKIHFQATLNRINWMELTWDDG